MDLDHHGDRDVRPGLVDLAVNVRLPGPPPWLARVIADTIAGLGSYPDPAMAAAAIATRHRVDGAAVLPTNGGAEAFTLIARALDPAYPVVVHPQFTEPEAALRDAGHHVTRAILSRDNGFALDPARVPEAADLVVVGNPTNPTGVLHSARTLASLRRPGRCLVVDEAFMDAVPGEPESLLAPSADLPGPADLAGVLVVRSQTKTWGLAGLRAGYVVGDPALIARLRAQQPPWSVSTPALAALVATSTPAAVAEAEAAAGDLTRRRAYFESALAAAGFACAAPSAAPFLLVDVSSLGSDRPVWQALREVGYAVRRTDTFPGLDDGWIRVAVRDEQICAEFVAALARLAPDRLAPARAAQPASVRR